MENFKDTPWILNHTNWGTVQNRKYEIAILPWGATEPHNLHLPYGTDTLESYKLACGAAELAWEYNVHCMVLPPIPLGVQNPGQIELPFCLHTRPSTQKVILEDILVSLQIQKVTKVIIVNSHGGNDFKPIIRELQSQFSNLFIGIIDWFRMKECLSIFDIPGDHAGEMETSLMQHLFPGEIKIQEAGKGKSNGFKLECMQSGLLWTPRNWSKVSVDTGIGNPQNATPEKGKQCYDLIVHKISEALKELSIINPGDIYK